MEEDLNIRRWFTDGFNSSDEKQYKTNLLRSINSYRKDGLFTDVVVVIDNNLFHTHKLVLSASSKVFHAMLTSDMKEKSEGRIDLSHSFIKASIFSELLDYIYIGKISINSHNVEDIMTAANFLMLVSLTNMCCDYLKGALVPDNCLGIMCIARRFGCYELMQKASKILKAEFLSVLGTDEFLKLSVEDLREVLQMDNVEVTAEEEVLLGLLRWIHHAPKQRLKHFRTLVQSVRLQYINPDSIDEFMAHDITIRTVCTHPELVKLIQEAKTAWRCRVNYNEILQVGNNMLPRNCLNRRKILLGCGGYDGGKCTHTSFAMNIDNFQVTYLAFMNVSKHDHGVAVVNSVLYVIGGFNSFRGPLNIVERYNPARNAWSMAAPMNSKRKSLGACTMNGKIYASGGLDANYSSLRGTEVYDPHSDSWQSVAQMGEPKYAHSLLSDGRYLYAIGGWKSAKMERYDPVSNSWTWLPSMQTPRAGPGAVILGRKIYVTGGYGDSSCTSTVEVYDLDQNRWDTIQSMSIPRWRSGIVALDDKIYVVGGRDSQWRYLDLIEVFNTKKRRWTCEGTLPVQVMGLRCCLLDVPIEHLE